MAQALLWRRRTCGRSHRRACPWDAGGWRRILLWLRLSFLRIWLRLPVFWVRLLPVLLRLSRVQLRLLSVLLRLSRVQLRLLPVLLRLSGLLSDRLLRHLVWLGLRERLLGFGQAGPQTRAQARAPLGGFTSGRQNTACQLSLMQHW